MSEFAIKAEGISKLYQIGSQVQAYRTLRESLSGAYSSAIAGWRRKSNGNRNTPAIWALKDVAFEVRPGEVLGIIGRNGAGKSTLLKIIGRITRPTEGQVRIRGRIGSLLEVGTGFHPELTGRENIYLNGAILGMHRNEIESKFDQIVDFAEIEQFLDTPVKRYSSGMYMRLAFAVAAHLEPEILLVDEVLAVGDAAFQKKCLGKMGQVAGEGRTVLFVSHNMGAIKSLCPRSIYMAEGRIQCDGSSDFVVQQYLKSAFYQAEKAGEITWASDEGAPGCQEVRLQSVRLLNSQGRVQDHINVSESFDVEFTYQINTHLRGMRAILVITTREGILVFASTDHDLRPHESPPGRYRSCVSIPGGLLNCIQYAVQIHIDIPGFRTLIHGEDFLYFTGVGITPRGSNYPENWPGVITPRLDWRVEKLDQ